MLNRNKLGQKKLLLVGAAAIAVCNALIAHSLLSGHATPSAEALEQVRQGPRVLVARHALPLGTILTPDAVAFVDWPKQLAAPDNPAGNAYFLDGASSPARLVGTVVRSDIAEGQPITRGALVAPGERGFLAAALGAGMRAVTIPVTERSGVGGFVFPGDRVDLMLTQTVHGDGMSGGNADSGGGQSVSVAETILHNLRVLATDQSMGSDLPGGHMVARPAHTVTLEVTPRNAEKIEVAQSVGTLSLALRALMDAPANGGANIDRAIASGALTIPANASRQDEERLIAQSSAAASDDAGSYVTGGDVSRFLRRSGPHMLAGGMLAGDRVGSGTSGPMRAASTAMSAAESPPPRASLWRGGAVVTVTRGKDVTPVSVGGQ